MRPAAALSALALAILASSPTSGAASPELSLRNLSAGTVLSIQHSILIPANSWQQRISDPGGRLNCFVRLFRAQPYDRVLKPGSQLVIVGAEQGGVTAKGQVFTWTRLDVRSESVSDVLCESPRNEFTPTIHEFASSVHGSIVLKLPDSPPVEIG